MTFDFVADQILPTKINSTNFVNNTVRLTDHLNHCFIFISSDFFVSQMRLLYDDVMTWKRFLLYRIIVRMIGGFPSEKDAYI